MSDQNFLNSIYKVGEKLKGRPLTQSEKDKIVENFNSQEGSAYDRARNALSEVVDVSGKVILEKRSSVSDIDRVLSDLRNEAGKWQSSKK